MSGHRGSLHYSVNPTAPQYTATIDAIQLLIVNQQPTFVAPQILIEFWRGATRRTDARPAGLGMSAEAANSAIDKFIDTFGLLPDTGAVFEEWRSIALAQQVHGTQVHDARLVAIMTVFSIDRILTNNVKDFRRYTHILAITPEELPRLF